MDYSLTHQYNPMQPSAAQSLAVDTSSHSDVSGQGNDIHLL
jgi:hypothetical protein